MNLLAFAREMVFTAGFALKFVKPMVSQNHLSCLAALLGRFEHNWS